MLVTNWHVFEPQAVQTGGVSAKVPKAGVSGSRPRDDHHRAEDDDRARQRAT